MTSRIATYTQPTKKHQLGVNLIEIMVALVIGLFLILGATTLYIKTQKTSDIDDSIAQLQETARYAMNIIESDARIANYWGLVKDPNQFDNKGDTARNLGVGSGNNYCGPTSINDTEDYPTDIEHYIEASNNSYYHQPYGIPKCSAKYTASTFSDTLTIRHAEIAKSTSTGSQLRACTKRNKSTITIDTNCSGGELHDLVVNGYYIDTKSDQSENVPSLRRKTLIKGPDFSDVEIISGIEDMQIELGWDDKNGAADSAGVVRYAPPETTVTDGRIISVRVWLLIRAEKPDPTFTDTRNYSYADRTYSPNDNYRRLLVSRTIFIRNAAGT